MVDFPLDAVSCLPMNQSHRNPVRDDAFGPSIGVELLELTDRRAVTRILLTDRHLNGVKIGQGGVLFTLADMAFAAAANSRPGVEVGLHAAMSYLLATKAGDQLTAEATLIAEAGKTSTYQVVVRNQHQQTVATFEGLAFKKRTETA